eukprot:1177867-Prorocentrum_minimum.AAC.5
MPVAHAELRSDRRQWGRCVCDSITSFYGTSCANNSKDTLNTPDGDDVYVYDDVCGGVCMTTDEPGAAGDDARATQQRHDQPAGGRQYEHDSSPRPLYPLPGVPRLPGSSRGRSSGCPRAHDARPERGSPGGLPTGSPRRRQQWQT